MDSNDIRVGRLEDITVRMGEAITMLREAVAKVATKDDIVVLTAKMDEKFGQQLTQAHNSVPVKVSIAISAVIMLISLAALLIPHLTK